MPNALIHETSPYLLQHAHNPVDWMPWGEPAFSRARTEDKPIFVSIGYSTCHWCHVMERESFENADIAAALNRHFINIKVDREERPDIDQIYMAFVQATTGQGGWPMSVWLTPDLHPIAGGTYFPPEDRYGRPGFLRVIERVAELWHTERTRLLQSSRDVVQALRPQHDSRPPTGLHSNWATQALRHFQRSFDPDLGGFGRAPKFPRPSVLSFLFRYAHHTGLHTPEGRDATEMALTTLRHMAAGGMHDHLGGGFHRYSVDARWHVPHFEKMLYDQAQLAQSYLEAYQITGDESHARTARGIFTYCLHDLAAPDGAFYAAEDADSLPRTDSKEKREGAYYTWTDTELRAVLHGEEYAEVSRRFNCRPGGNVDPASDPHGELAGQNVLIETHPQSEELWSAAQAKLLTARQLRPRPQLDDKILTAWNGLMISALARGSRVLDDPLLLDRARATAEFLRSSLWRGGVLLRTWRAGKAQVPGFLSDHAFLIGGLLDLYEAGGDGQWLDWALELQAIQDTLFTDPNGGLFNTRADDKSLILRLRDDHDGAEPAACSVAAWNSIRLAAMTQQSIHLERARSIIATHAADLAHQGTAFPLLLAAALALDAPHAQAVFAGDLATPAGRHLLHALARRFHPTRVTLYATVPRPRALAHLNVWDTMVPVNGQPTVYLCENFTCRAPITDAGSLS